MYLNNQNGTSKWKNEKGKQNSGRAREANRVENHRESSRMLEEKRERDKQT